MTFTLIALIVLGILLVWLIVISYLYLRLKTNYDNFLDGTQKKSLSQGVEQMLETQKQHHKQLAEIMQRCDRMESEGKLHIQKIGLLRFNPFNDTGGDQSFILSLLDAKETGVVISGLFARSGTRWYAKKVNNGKGIDHELSADEKQAILKAQK